MPSKGSTPFQVIILNLNPFHMWIEIRTAEEFGKLFVGNKTIYAKDDIGFLKNQSKVLATAWSEIQPNKEADSEFYWILEDSSILAITMEKDYGCYDDVNLIVQYWQFKS